MNVNTKKEIVECENVKLSTFTFNQNSCYLDSVLFALFSIPSEVIKELKQENMVDDLSYYVENKKEFHDNILFLINNKKDFTIDILDRIRNYIRSNIKDSKKIAIWDDKRQQDADEFLHSFCDIYNINYVSLSADNLLHNLIDVKDLFINRLHNPSKNYNLVTKFEETNKDYILTHVICYLGEIDDNLGSKFGHYIVWFKCKDIWYKYDNLESDLITKSSEKEIEQIKQNGYLFFYKKPVPMAYGGYKIDPDSSNELLNDLSKYKINKINKNKFEFYVHLLKKRNKLIDYIEKINVILEKELLQKHSNSLLLIKNKLTNYMLLLTEKNKLSEYYSNLESNIEYVKKSLKKIK
jgi:hypothetical protein